MFSLVCFGSVVAGFGSGHDKYLELFSARGWGGVGRGRACECEAGGGEHGQGQGDGEGEFGGSMFHGVLQGVQKVTVTSRP